MHIYYTTANIKLLLNITATAVVFGRYQPFNSLSTKTYFEHFSLDPKRDFLLWAPGNECRLSNNLSETTIIS